MSGRRNLVKAVVDLDDRLSRKLATVGRSVRGFRREQADGERATRGWGNALRDWNTKVHNYFGSKTKSLVRGWFLSMKVSAAIGMAGVTASVVGAVRKFTELDATIRNTTGLLTGAGMGSKEADRAYAAFTDDVMRLAPKLAKSPQDLANSLYDIVGGGFEGADATKVLESATKGASAGMAQTETVANALVKTLQAYGYEADKSAEITDLMFQSVNLGIISFDELAQNLGDVVGLASTAQVSFSDLMASIAIMTRKGMVPAEAFTSLNQLMLAILAPGTAEQEAAAEIFGKNHEDMWSSRAMAAKGLGGVMEGLMKKLNPSRDQIARLNSLNNEVADMAAAEIAGDKLDVLTSLFGNVRALRGALVLASGGTYTFADAQEDMKDSVGAADRVMAEQEKTIKRQMDRIKAYWEVIQLEVMEDVAPAIGEKAKQVSDWFAEITGGDEYKNAEGFGKLKVLGSAVWEEITGWWERNKDAVSKRLSDGLSWLGSTAVPYAVEFGLALGKEIVPAIWKGMNDSPVGQALIAALALSWANKLGPQLGSQLGRTTGAGGAGGAGAGAGGAGAGGIAPTAATKWTVGNIAANGLAVYGAFTAVRALADTSANVGADLAGAQMGLEEQVRIGTSDGLREGMKAAKDEGLWEGLAMDAWSAIGGERAKTAEDVVREEQDRRRPFETANTIRAYQDNDLINTLAQLWQDPDMWGSKAIDSSDSVNMRPALERLFAGDKVWEDALKWEPDQTKLDNLLVDWWKENMSGMGAKAGDLMRQYAQDPSKLSDLERRAVEFTIEATPETIAKIMSTAGDLSGKGLDPISFANEMREKNPILADMDNVTEQWATEMVTALEHLKDVNYILSQATEDWWAEHGKDWWERPIAGGSPENPTHNGWREPTAEEREQAAIRDYLQSVHAEEQRRQRNEDRAAIGGQALLNDWLNGLGGPSGGLFGGGGVNGRFYSVGDIPEVTVNPAFTEAITNAIEGQPEPPPPPAPSINFNAPLVGMVKVADVGKKVEDVAEDLAKLLWQAIANGAGSD